MKNYNEVPIVALTAYASDTDKDEFLTKGFSHYLSKPFTINELNKLLADALK
jgi:CheY-like chemotaxis protein